MSYAQKKKAIKQVDPLIVLTSVVQCIECSCVWRKVCDSNPDKDPISLSLFKIIKNSNTGFLMLTNYTWRKIIPNSGFGLEGLFDSIFQVNWCSSRALLSFSL